MGVVLTIRLDDLRDPRIGLFLEEHLADMRRVSPPESAHALDLSALRQPDIRFWTAWVDTPGGPSLAGTSALKRLDDAHAEIKSMRTASAWRGQGVAEAMLTHVLDRARAAGYRQVSLETGRQDFFMPARALYAKHGFGVGGPFGPYGPDPNSCFMTKVL